MDKQQSTRLLAPNQADAVSVSGMIFHFLAAAEDTGGQYGLIEITVLSGIGPPTHRHRAQEAFYVLDGEFEFRIGEQTMTGTAGAFVNIPSMLFHGWRNIGNSVGKLQCLSVPGGIEGFFREAGHPVTDSNAPPIPPSPADAQKQIALAPRYGIEVVSPGDDK